MVFFDQVEMAPRDAIFGLTVAFLEDPRPNKINLGVGIYRNAELQPVLFSAVKKAEMLLAEEGRARPYLPIDGDPEYVMHTQELLLAAGAGIYGAQTVGATAALRLSGELLANVLGKKAIYLPAPTWANHKAIFTAAGMQVEQYPYFDRNTKTLAFDQMMETLGGIPEGSVVLLHTCCHNPTGIDPDQEQWKAIRSLFEKRNLFPVFDCAYQGFGEGLEEDVAGLRSFLGMEGLVCYSYSKNFGLYGERTGALFVMSGSEEVAERIGSQIRLLARANYSNPPRHGAAIVKTVLGSDDLRREWLSELDAMRARIQEMRRALMAGLLAKGGERDFHFLAKQKGLFSFCGLERDQAERLTAEYGIYLPKSGRINVTGINSQNVDTVVDAIISVL